MYKLHKKQLTTNQLSQLYRRVQLNYLLEAMPNNDIMRNVDMLSYQAFSLIGTISEIKVEMIDKKQYFCPIIDSLFSNSKKSQKIYIPAAIYKQNFIKLINKILKRKSQCILMFTQLEPFLLGGLVYGITQKTCTLALSIKYIQREFKAIFNTFQNHFSYLKLEKIFNPSQVQFYKSNGIPLQDLKKKISTNVDPTITGVIEVKFVKLTQEGRKRCRQMVLNLYQSQIRCDSKQLGICTMKIRYYEQQEYDLKYKLKNWNTVTFKNIERAIDNKGRLQYYVNNLNQIQVVDDKHWRYANKLDIIWNNLNITLLKQINPQVLRRNFIKVKVQLIKMSFIKLSFECKKCFKDIRTSYCLQCQSKGQLQLWSQCYVQDSTRQGILSIQGDNLIKYFNFSQEDKILLQQLCIKYNRYLWLNKQTEAKDKMIQRLLFMMNIQRIQREVIGIPTLDTKKSKNQFQQKSLLLSDTNKYRSLNINGVIQKKDKADKWMTKIKVHYVL